MPRGRPFEKGRSGNPGGRPKVAAEVRELARQYTDVAIKALTDIMQDEKSPPAARVSAATVLLDRAYGRAPQDLTVKGSIEQHIIDLVRQLDIPPDAPAKRKSALH